MRRSLFRRTPRLETLESRQVLSTAGPTADQQYMLAMINLARTDPAEAAQKFTTNLDPDVIATINYYNVNINQVRSEIASSPVRPPLAWNNTLAQAANGMATDQAVNGFQSHTGSNGSTLSQRLSIAGYPNPTQEGENTYAYSKSVDHAMEAFLIDWGVAGSGHRNTLLQPNATPDQFYKEVGIAIVPTQNSKVGPLVITQDFGASANTPADVLGVVYNDNAGTGIFADGEGVGNVEIDATNIATGQTVSTQTWASGGYQIPLNPGQYTIQAIQNGQVIQASQVNIGTQNIEIDYNLTALQQQAPAPAAVAAPAPTAAAATTPGNADTNTSFGDSWSTWSV